ncbi:MAG: Hpt domain-containing protein, partial [Candidatus Delongbacteria bacterium]|nr:Hpt domain-containing protein [Candidatus Delongbacteria bacterium]
MSSRPDSNPPNPIQPAVIDEDTRELIQSFIGEGLDMIDQVEPQIDLILTEQRTDTINSIFRLFHSLKGLASFLNFENVKLVTHEAETLLDLFRRNISLPGQETTDILYKTIDQMRKMIEFISQYNTDSGLEGESAQLRDQIRQLFTAIREKSGHDSQDELLSVEQIDQLMADSEHQAFTSFETASQLIGPEILERYLTESIELIETIEKDLLELERNPGQTDIMKDIFRNVHSLKGDSGFMGFADVESICM